MVIKLRIKQWLVIEKVEIYRAKWIGLEALLVAELKNIQVHRKHRQSWPENSKEAHSIATSRAACSRVLCRPELQLPVSPCIGLGFRTSWGACVAGIWQEMLESQEAMGEKREEEEETKKKEKRDRGRKKKKVRPIKGEGFMISGIFYFYLFV